MSTRRFCSNCGSIRLRAGRVKSRIVPASVLVVAGILVLLGLLNGCGHFLESLCDLIGPPQPPSTVDRVAVTLLASGFTSPLGFAIPDDGTRRKFVIDQVGLIHILDAEGVLLSQPFLDLSGKIVELSTAFDERGLLGLAFHPSYAENGRFFVCYNAPLGPDAPDGFNSILRISEFEVAGDDANRADSDSERIILEILKPQFNHNGGQIGFGPDNYLYISVGDGGAGNDVGLGHTEGLGNGQDLTVLLGKILRIDVDNGDPFGIPPDNPFAGNDDNGARNEIFAFGLRNPFRFSFDMGGAHRLFVGDAGQNLFEEVDIIVAGGNYGWNIMEGPFCFDPDNPDDPPDDCPNTGPGGEALIDPIIHYPHVQDTRVIGVVVINGFVYRGTAIPELDGEFLFGDFTRDFLVPDGSLFAAREMSDGTWLHRELAIADKPGERLGAFVLAFAQDDEGEVYICTSQNLAPTGSTGQIYRIVPAP